MNSIRQKLLTAFFAAIFAILGLIGLLLFIHFRIVNLYKNQIDNMILQYSLIDQSSQLITAYNNYIKYVGDRQRKQTYTDSLANISQTINRIDQFIVDPDSLITYKGLKANITKVIELCNTGIALAESNQIEQLSDHYYQANKQLDFVKENIADLILNELNYAPTIQKQINQTRNLSFTTGGITIAFVSLSTIVLVIIFSRSLTHPIFELTQIAKNIAAGDLKTIIPDQLQHRRDELGSLAQSFNIMIKNLQQTITKLDQSNQSLLSTKDKLESANNQLSKMNNFMVGRELDMIKLKKQLKDALATKTDKIA